MTPGRFPRFHSIAKSLCALIFLALMGVSHGESLTSLSDSKVQLLGVISVNSQLRAMVSLETEEGTASEEFVGKGDLVAGFTLLSIKEDRVVLRRNRDECILRVNGEMQFLESAEKESVFALPEVNGLWSMPEPRIQLAEAETEDLENRELKVIRADTSKKVQVNAPPRFIYPFRQRYRVSSPFGPRRRPRSRNGGALGSFYHKGVDIAAPHGTVVYASASGTVKESGYGGAKGRYIIISHANGYETHYYHLYKRYVSKGKVVRQGDAIGREGNTGTSSGPHLHFGILKDGVPLDPANFIPACKK